MKTSSPIHQPGAFCLNAFLGDSAKIPAESERDLPPQPRFDAPRPSSQRFSLRAFLNMPPRTVQEAGAPVARHGIVQAAAHVFSHFHWHGARTTALLLLMASALQASATTRQQWVAAQSASQQAAYRARMAGRVVREQDYLESQAANFAAPGIVPGQIINGSPITPGMTDQQVLSIWGMPIENQTFNTPHGPGETWVYHPLASNATTVTFVNHMVVSIQ